MSEQLAEQLTKEIISTLNEQLQFHPISLHTAISLLEAGEAYATTLKVPVVLAIVDAGGNLIAQHRMNGAIIASIELSKAKAYTSLALRLPTEELAKEIQPGKSLYGLQNTCPGKFCFFGGGIPLLVNDTCVGAIGVSGGTVEQDTSIAKAIEGAYLNLH